MRERYYAQRRHIIHSLDTLLYQLHTLSFFLSPSIWPYACRLISQLHASTPRELDSNRSLLFFFNLILLFNTGSIWSHATQEAAEDKAVVLDFVGLARSPSKLHLLFLDFVIILLQLLLTTIAYETSLSHETHSDTPDSLLPSPSALPSPIVSTSPSARSLGDYTKTSSSYNESTLVLDLHMAIILEHLKNPPATTSESTRDPLLPLPSTSPWRFPPALRALMMARAELRQFAGNSGLSVTNRLQEPPGTMGTGNGG